MFDGRSGWKVLGFFMTLPPNFGYIWKDRIAGSAHPGAGKMLVEHLAGLREIGVQGILSLTERPLEPAPLSEFEMDALHLPIEDFAAPDLGQIKAAVAFFNAQLAKDHGVLAHCRAGIGRTGTILACFLVSQGMEPAKAIQEVRRLRPGSIEVYPQEYAIFQYALEFQRDNPPGETASP